MKFHDTKIATIIRKGFLFSLPLLLAGTLLSGISAGASDSVVQISAEETENFHTHMTDEGYGPNKFEKAKQRIVLLSQFLNELYPEINAIPKDDADDYVRKEIKWDPSQDDIDKNRDLYILEWTNGDYKDNPGSGYEILGRIVYIDDENNVCYTPQVNIDEYARDLLDLGYKEQWDQGRINQCTFAMPESCKQIVGVLMCNESGGGHNNNTWWMDSFYISRIVSDDLDDISSRRKNDQGDNYCPYNNGHIVGFVSDHDISNRYLGGDDVDQEWLYLLQTPLEAVASGNAYYAQIVTGNSDLSGKELTLTIEYVSIDGVTRTYQQKIDDSTVKNTYPKLTFPTEFHDGFYWLHTPFSSHSIDTFKSQVLDYWDYQSGAFSIKSHDSAYSIHIGMEVMNKNGALDEREVFDHLKKFGEFQDYRWEDANMTETNFMAAFYFGNYANYAEMNKDILGPYTSTDVRLNIPYYVAKIESITLQQKKGSADSILQDIRIYTADPDDFTRTSMNGGIGTERVFMDVENAKCLVSIDAPDGIYVVADSLISCSWTKDPLNRNSYLLKQSAESIDHLEDDDNLGIQISLADVYEAGFDEFMTRYLNDFKKHPQTSSYVHLDYIYSSAQLKNYILDELQDQDHVSKRTALEILNLMEAYYREPLALNIRYVDDFGARREVSVPFVTAYMLQLYSDNNGKLGTNDNNHITGVLLQGQDAALRVPLSQFDDIIDITLSFGKLPEGITPVKSNKYFYYDGPLNTLSYTTILGSTYSSDHKSGLKYVTRNYPSKDSNDASAPLDVVLEQLDANETIIDGRSYPNNDMISIRSLRVYKNVTKDSFHTVYDPAKRVTTFHTELESDYYYVSPTKEGTSFNTGRSLTLSLENNTLKRGAIDYTQQDLENVYLVEIAGQDISGEGNVCNDLYVTLSYTNTSGEELKIDSRLLSVLAKDYNGNLNMSGIKNVTSGSEYQTLEDLKAGCAYYTIEIEDVSRFDSIHLSLPDGETNGWQANSISVYSLSELGQRYSQERHYKYPPVFSRDFEGTRVAFNNKATALQPGKEGKTFYFTKVNSDGTLEEPDLDEKVESDYLLTPPTSMTYEETLKNLGLAVTKYTYTVDVSVANVADAGSSNYFYFQLVFENGTSGVVLANQQLTADSFRQGYTESFSIHTTQNYGNVTAVRVICDVSSAGSQAFDKLNIEKITVSLPSSGGAKSWIVDKVGWIDINYQDEGIASTLSSEAEQKGFPNSQVVKEFARTRTASTARLLFNISTAADSQNHFDSEDSTYEGSLVYEDSAGYTQTYNFNLRSAIYNFNENNSSSNLFRPNMSDYFTLSLNDVTRIKSLSIYRSNGNKDWIIKDISISQFSELGDVYIATSGEFRRYIENETLITSSTNSNQKISSSGNASFSFEDHNISINVNNNNPETWTTTITRLPVTEQESLNVYLYAGSTEQRTYAFDASNPPVIKGRLEYTLRESGSAIGSQAFTFENAADINGTTVLKAAGVKVTGMNQLKNLHLQLDSQAQPIISGARVERIRGNTIVETLYFDFANAEMITNQNYTALAKADTSSAQTTQVLALQLSDGQEQVFTGTSDIAVALLYTSENDRSSTQKTVYSSPNVFFSEAGITSIGNTSILEVPFNIKGADEIAGISIISSGPNIHFDNAIVYNYVESGTGEKVLLDTCQISQSFRSSTVQQKLLKEDNTNVTPVTFKFTTSGDEEFPGAGTSGRLPLTISYKTIHGQDKVVEFENFSAFLPVNTLPTAGSEVSFEVLLSDFSQLTSLTLEAPNDDWHLYKVSAEISTINGNTASTQQREAFVDSWITARTSAVAVFGTGNDSENIQDEILSFSVTAQTDQSKATETAVSGNVLKIQAIPDENVTLTPQITANGSPVNTVIWDKTLYEAYMNDNGSSGLTFRVPVTHLGSDSVGQIFSFTGYCSFDTQKSITVAIEVVQKEDVPVTGETGTSDHPEEDSSAESLLADVEITVSGNGTSEDGPELPTFRSEDGASQEYTITVTPDSPAGQWNFQAAVHPDGYTASFTNAALEVSAAGPAQTTDMIICNADGIELLRVTIHIVTEN